MNEAKQGPGAHKTPRHMAGLDSLRFVLATWVALGHGAWLPLRQVTEGQGRLVHVAAGLLGAPFYGTFAVAVFFLLSGLCIHYPNVGKARVNWTGFLLGRACRIGVPLIAILLITTLLGPAYRVSLQQVLWSVYCEIIYYALYPIFFRVIERRPKALLIGACVASALLLASRPGTVYVWEFGVALTWLFCAPMWIAGAMLAEWLRTHDRPATAPRIWLWRLGAVAACTLVQPLLWHKPPLVGVPYVMIPFAVFAVFWLQREVFYFSFAPPTHRLERIGLASYTLYLVHKPVLTAFATPPIGPAALIPWAGQTVALCAATALFFFTIERPAHRTARVLARMDFLARRPAEVSG